MDFLPTTRREMQRLGWRRLDVVLVSGDAYVDSPFSGAAVIGRVLAEAGFRVGVIAQPDTDRPDDIRRLGRPRLFWGVTGGCVDSMVANYTATGRRRKRDDFTPGGRNDRRPDRAVIVYCNLIRQAFKPPGTIVIGGIEASLRRISHYDFWSDRVRRSILFDARADVLVYGMGEATVTDLARRLRAGRDYRDLSGICYIAPQPPGGSVQLPSHARAATDPRAFTEMFATFYDHCDPRHGAVLCQQQDTRWLVQNPAAAAMKQSELDAVHALGFQREAHPSETRSGAVRALDTIRHSIISHRGCYGECNFCAIAVHQGRTVTWRSRASLVAEARRLAAAPDFRGHITDVGGPTANMYGFECERKLRRGACRRRRCLHPEICEHLPVDHRPQRELLAALRDIPGVRRVSLASGLRHDLVLADAREGPRYLEAVVRHHVSGQLKLAPEHCEDGVLRRMGKPSAETVLEFKRQFDRLSRRAGRRQYLTYYLMAAHPGCGDRDMRRLGRFASARLRLRPEQVQIFTPTPSTWSTLMYHTGRDPFEGVRISVEKDTAGKRRQKALAAAESGRRRKTAARRPARPKPPRRDTGAA